MNSMWVEALSGINAYVKALEDVDIMLATFDSMGYDVIRNTTTEDWREVTTEEVTPRGSTPLLDAAGRMMYNMIDSGAKRAILVIVTDGEENCSTKFKKSEIVQLTKKINEELDYEMVFLGANFDKVGEVATNNFQFNNISGHQTRSYAATQDNFVGAMMGTATATQAYMSSGKAAMFYTDDIKKKMDEGKK